MSQFDIDLPGVGQTLETVEEFTQTSVANFKKLVIYKTLETFSRICHLLVQRSDVYVKTAAIKGIQNREVKRLVGAISSDLINQSKKPEPAPATAQLLRICSQKFQFEQI